MNSRAFRLRLLAAMVPALIAGLTPAFGLTMEEALDAPSLTWTAASGWYAVADAAARDGVDVAQVTDAGYNNAPRLQTTVTGPGVLRLWWQITSGHDEGQIVLAVDGIGFLTRNTEKFPWEQVAVNVPAGSHTVAAILNAGGSEVIMMADQAEWSPGQRLPAAVALGDPDGFWAQEGEWQQVPGETRDGTGDAARLQYQGGQGQFQLKRRMSGPATVRYWQKMTTATPAHYQDAAGKPFPASWTQATAIVSGPPGQTRLLELSGRAIPGAASATLWLDDLEITPLTLATAVDLPAASTEFTITFGGSPWRVSGDEADFRRTGSVEVAPNFDHATAEMHTDFNGPGLLTWSWRKWSDLDETMTVMLNGTSLGVFNDDKDTSPGFAHVARLLPGTGTNSVLWRFQWGDNGFNPMALDDILFSPPAPADVREAVEVAAGAPLYATSGTPWTSQALVTHDGSDALELPAAGLSSRAALTQPVTGPGILRWWWRSDLPEGASFRLHRQGREARSISGSSGWKQEFLALRAGEEFVRWELFPGSIPAGASHHVWLDEVTFVPQTVTVAEAADFPGHPWTATGDVLAASLPTPESRDGTDAIVLTGPHNTLLPAVSLESSFTGPGLLTFWIKTQRGPEYYGFPWQVQLDGGTQPFVLAPGTDGWNTFSLPLPAGSHTVRWMPFTGAVMTLDQVSFNAGDGYSRWAQTLFSAGQPSGELDDPDGDGMPNLLEFAFDTLPLDPQSSRGPGLRKLPSGKTALEFVRDISRTDITWEAEVSSDLVSWNTVPASVVSIDGYKETMVAELPEGHAFARVKVKRGL